jgi:hypothetical protein
MNVHTYNSHDIIIGVPFNELSLCPKVVVIEIGHIDESAINSLISHKYEFFGNHFVNNIYVRK